MKRRDFLAASALAALTPFTSFADAPGSDREYYELRKYTILNRSKQKVFNNFMKDAFIPAVNRMGIEPVGAFNVVYGPNNPTVYILLPHKSIESVVTLGTRLMDDSRFKSAGSSVINSTSAEPGYVRIESSLMLAFKDIPKIELPKNKSGLYELRTYESHSLKAAKKKIHMFNEGGEIQLFRDTGLNPVFFGETLIGPQMPNLTYMLAFKDMDDRDKSWPVFVKSDGWQKLSKDPFYADTVSNITAEEHRLKSSCSFYVVVHTGSKCHQASGIDADKLVFQFFFYYSAAGVNESHSVSAQTLKNESFTAEEPGAETLCECDPDFSTECRAKECIFLAEEFATDLLHI